MAETPTGILQPDTGIKPDAPTPGFVELLGAGLLRESVPARLLWQWQHHKGFDPEDGYNALRDDRLKDIGSDIEYFAHSASSAETSWLLENRQKDIERKKMLTDAGVEGMVASMVGAVLNPSTLIPPLRVGERAGWGVKTGVAMAGASALEQTALAGMDAAHTRDETVIGTLLAGGVGWGVGKLAGRYHPQATAHKAAMDEFEGGPPPPAGTGLVRAVDEPPPGGPRPMEFDADGTARPAAVDPMAALRPNEAEINAARAQRVDDLQGMGAAQAPGAALRTDAEIMEDLYPKPAMGLERLSVNPMMGMLNSGLRETRELVEQLVEIPFFLRQDAKGIARMPSIESGMRAYRNDMASALRDGTANWLQLRTGKGGDTLDQLKLQAADFFKRAAGMSYDDYMTEVGKALRRGDRHAIPEVAATAKRYRAVFDRMAKEAADVGAFDVVQEKRRAVVRLRETLGDKADVPVPADPALRQAGGWDADAVKLKEHLDDVMKELRKVEGKVPDVTTAESFLPRLWRHDRIMAEQPRLEGILADWYRATSPGIDPVAAAKETVQKLLHDEPFRRIDDVEVTGTATSLHKRTLEVPDELVEDFLESNAEAVLTHHVRTMSADIEIVRHQNRRWDMGLVNMHHDRKEIEKAWDARLDAFRANGDAAAAGEALLQKEADLARVVGLRDRLRGAVGLTMDPWSPSARAIRLAKQTASILYMGGAALTATLDLARPIMTEGLTRTLRDGYAPLFRDSRKLIMQMAKGEAQLAGTAFGHELGLRGAMLMDTGDVFGRYSKAEGVVSKMADMTFVANGLNWVDQSARTVASMVVGTRIIKDAERLARGTLKAEGVEKLARAGIDQPMAERIAGMTSLHAENVDGVWIANTGKWQDLDAAAAYRRALGEDIDRTVPLRGVGDTPLFMSQPMGSLLMLFRAFGFSALMRTTMPALQQRDRASFVGFALMTGMGAIVNEIRDVQNGRKTDRSFGERIARAVDRSGIAGIGADVVNGATRIAERGLPGVIDTAGGPAASIGLDVGKVLIDLANRNMTPQGGHAARRLLPWNTMVWADGLFDVVEAGMAPSRATRP